MQTPLSVLLKDKGNKIYKISPHETVYNSALTMKQLGIGALLVMIGKKLKGIISERDIIQKLVICSYNPTEMRVVDIMTKDLVTVTPRTTVQEAMRIVTERRFRHLPVLENDKLEGLISIGDLTRWVMLSQQHDISALTDYIQGSNGNYPFDRKY